MPDARKIELLAPARDAAVAIEAVRHGADAVYIGAKAHGARAAASNPVSDIAKAVDFAHRYDARVYATVNTILYDSELRDVEAMIKELYRVGVDALIVQDMGILRMDLPPIELHASTQCDIRTPQKAKWLESLGFSQIVLARELTLDEIAAICGSVKVAVECFVHGALCVSYSGRCQVSYALKGRSANRGECAQICRLPYQLVDAQGNVIVARKHLLSLRDFNQSDRLERLLEAGVTSFKIEGRLKDVSYVKNVVAHYRRRLDDIIAASGNRYAKASCGQVELAFTPDVRKSFNRSFTHYFTDGRHPADGHQIASVDTPKSVGETVGIVTSCAKNRIRVKSAVRLSNGDGLSYFTSSGEYRGFRVNSVEHGEIVTLIPEHVKPGTLLYRTNDAAHERAMAKDSATRRIGLSARLVYNNDYLSLSLSDERGVSVTKTIHTGPLDKANEQQTDRQIAAIGKLGGTIYTLKAAQAAGGVFVPLSTLASLRRDAVALLDAAHRACYRHAYRRKEDVDAVCFASELDAADNVSNSLASLLYRQHGVTRIEPAAEVAKSAVKQAGAVMHTRYCLRRELGACLKGKNAKRLPDSLYLRSGKDILLRVEFDCHCCEMRLYVGRK